MRSWKRFRWAAVMLLGATSSVAACAAGGEGGDAASARAALEEGAEEPCLVGEETIEHACAHAQLGPFQSTPAQSYPGFVFSDVNAPHTSYSVQLPGGAAPYEGAVLYQPAVSGQFAFFVTPETALVVYDSAGQVVAPVGDAPVDPALCAAMDHVSVLVLSDAETYTVVLGPSASPSPSVIVEYLGEGGCESCEHVHLVAAKNYGPPPSWENAVVSLEHPITFEIPAEIPVTEGNAGNHWAHLRFRLGSGPVVRCSYRGGASVPHPSTPAQLALAARYVFFGCNNGMAAGDDAEADWFKLRVLHGGNACFGGRTEVELEIEDEACHGHEHEE